MKKVKVLFLLVVTMLCSSCDQLIWLYEDDVKQQIKIEIASVNYSVSETKMYVNNGLLREIVSWTGGVEDIFEKKYDEAVAIFDDVIENIPYDEMVKDDFDLAVAIDNSFEELIGNRKYKKHVAAREVYNVYRTTSVVLSDFKSVNDDTWEVTELQSGIKYYVELLDDGTVLCTADEMSLAEYLERFGY